VKRRERGNTCYFILTPQACVTATGLPTLRLPMATLTPSESRCSACASHLESALAQPAASSA
jgi:hypothetical protein